MKAEEKVREDQKNWLSAIDSSETSIYRFLCRACLYFSISVWRHDWLLTVIQVRYSVGFPATGSMYHFTPTLARLIGIPTFIMEILFNAHPTRSWHFRWEAAHNDLICPHNPSVSGGGGGTGRSGCASGGE